MKEFDIEKNICTEKKEERSRDKRHKLVIFISIYDKSFFILIMPTDLFFFAIRGRGKTQRERERGKRALPSDILC